MKDPIHLTKPVSHVRDSLSCCPWRQAFPLIGVVANLTLSPAADSVTPPPDGGYVNQNTAEGEDALFGLTTGKDNTAVGFNALFANTFGFDNTAVGSEALRNTITDGRNSGVGSAALQNNTSGATNTAVGFDVLKGAQIRQVKAQLETIKVAPRLVMSNQ